MPKIRTRFHFLRFVVMILPILILDINCAHRPTSNNQDATENWRYDIKVIPSNETSHLEIELTFHGNENGLTTLSLPSEWLDEKAYYKGIQNLQAISPWLLITETGKPETRTLKYAPGAEVRLRYTLIQDWVGDFKKNRPILNARYFHFNGIAVLAHSEVKNDQPVHVQILWTAPTKWTIGNSFGADSSHQDFQTTLGGFNESVFVGGDFRLHEIQVHGHPVELAIRGTWRFSDREFRELVERVVRSQREFWNDFDVPFYLVMIMPNQMPCCKYQGIGLTHSFAAYFPESEYALHRLAYVLAHEHFHYWNGEKIAPIKEEDSYWFTEGFTDYYARRLNLRAGLSDFPRYVDDYNGVIYRYESDPEKTWPNAKAGANSVTYSRGNILAMEWNRAIERESGGQHSLDDFMKDLFLESKKQRQVISNESIIRLLTKYLKDGGRHEIKKYIEDGEIIHPSPDVFASLAKFKIKDIGRFDTGFSESYAQPVRVVSALKTNSAAFAAGLRDGQTILDKRIEWWKPWNPVELRVRTPDGDKWVKYLPQSSERIQLPHYRLNGD